MTDPDFASAAARLDCDEAAIRAVFDVESSGAFLIGGLPPRRFEPHHFPAEHWSALGFAPGSTPPWRAAKALSRAARADMFVAAVAIDEEAASAAASWGAPQIMGFNAGLCGYGAAVEMREAFRDPQAQVDAFCAYVIARGLDGAIRAHDWRTFAAAYNGSGQVGVYAARIETAYRRHSGGRATAEVLREGARGDAVAALQTALSLAGQLPPQEIDGDFGPRTRAAVQAFQAESNLAVDGVVGAKTWAALREAAPSASARAAAPPAQPSAGEVSLVKGVASLSKSGLGAGVGAFGMQAYNGAGDGARDFVIYAAAGLGAVAVAVMLYVWAAPRLAAARRSLMMI